MTQSKEYSDDALVRQYLEFIDYYIPHIHILDLLDDDSPYYFDVDAAEDAIEFIEKGCVHIKGKRFAGKPLLLEDWQRAIFLCAFGVLKKSDGFRRFLEIWLEVPRKNGKSTIGAGFGLILLSIDGESGAEVYSAAADKKQAKIVFNVAKQMVLKSNALRKRLQTFADSIVYDKEASSYQAISSDADTKHGFNTHGLVVDEVHAHKDREFIDVLHTSTGTRDQPMEVYITTAGIYDPNTIYFEKHDYAEKVISGAIKDDTLLPIIYAAGKDDDWKDPETHKKANPGYGTIVKAEYLMKECKKAQEVPAYENTFKRLHLNIITEQVDRWMPMESWLPCAADFTLEDLIGNIVWGGLDLSATTDLTALALLFRTDDGIYRPWFRYWIPGTDVIKRQKRDRVPYPLWVEKGHIYKTPTNVIDYAFVRKELNELKKKIGLKKLALDRWNATQLATELDGDGFEVVMHGTTKAAMNNPMKELMRLVMGNGIQHANDPVTNWMMSNVASKMDADGNIKPDKLKSTGRIDGIAALLMALGLAIVEPPKKKIRGVFYI